MKHKTNILLVRHGQTEWNQQQRIQGNQNSALTEQGKQQALITKQALEHISIGQAFVSPLNRAIDTINIILNDDNLEIKILPDLREISLGSWEGKTEQEIALSHPDQFNNFWHSPDAFKLAGAETFQQLQDRVINALELIFSLAENTNILVVTHFMVIKVAIAFYEQIPISQLANIPPPQNASFICLSKTSESICITNKVEI